MKPKDNVAAYDLVAATVKATLAHHKKARDRSPTVWLCEHLGITRQTLHRYSQAGFEPRHVKRLSDLTGLPPEYIRLPAPVSVDYPADIAEELIVVAKRKRATFPDYMINLAKEHLRQIRRK